MAAIDEARAVARQVQSSQGWYANRLLLEKIARTLIMPWQSFYAQASSEERLEIEQIAGEWVAGALVAFDDEFSWDFPRMADSVEDYFLGVYGRSLAASVLRQALILHVT